jgi:hypothetical protein
MMRLHGMSARARGFTVIGELKSVGMYVTQLWRDTEYCANAAW